MKASLIDGPRPQAREVVPHPKPPRITVWRCAPGRAAAQSLNLRIVIIEGEDAINIIEQKTVVAPVVEARDRNDQPVAGARLFVPIYHKTFQLSDERFGEPIERTEAALAAEPDRLVVRDIGDTVRVA